MFLTGTLIGENKVDLQECLNYLKQENFYQQEYCGCVYSLRDTNNWRVSKGREKVERGVKFYQEAKLKLSQSD